MKIKAKTENDAEFWNNLFSSLCAFLEMSSSEQLRQCHLCPWVQFSVPTESMSWGCGPRCNHPSIYCLSDRCSRSAPKASCWTVKSSAFRKALLLPFHQISLFCFWAGHQLVPHVPCSAGEREYVFGAGRVSAALWHPHLGKSLTPKALCITLSILAKPFPSPLHLNFCFQGSEVRNSSEPVGWLSWRRWEWPPSAGDFILFTSHHINSPASSVVSDRGPMALSYSFHGLLLGEDA